MNLLNLSLGVCIGLLPWSEKWNTLSVIALSLIIFYDYFILKGKPRINLKKMLYGSIIFWVSLFWLINTDNMSDGLKYIERIASAILFPILFSFIAVIYDVNFKHVFRVFLVSCATRYIFFLITVLDWELIYILDYWKEMLIQFNQFFMNEALHPSYFSMYLGFCALLCYNFFTVAKSFISKFIWILGIWIFLLMNLSLGAKMPFIATLVALVFGALFQIYRLGKDKKKYLFGFLTGVFLFGIYIFSVPNSILQDYYNYYNYFNKEKLNSTYDYGQYGTNYSLETWTKTNRIYIWKSSMELLKDNFIYGVGTGDIKNELNLQYKKNNQVYLASKNANTHNQYLDYLIKFGILGFCLISFGFIVYFREALATSNHIYIMFIVLTVLCMFTENILNRQFGIVFFFFFNSSFFFLTDPNDSKKA